jgi:hypothetical protein
MEPGKTTDNSEMVHSVEECNFLDRREVIEDENG